MVDQHTLEALYADDFEHVEDDFGESLWHYHRVDLHQIVRALATDGQEKPQATIRFGAPVDDVDPENGIITLRSGEQVKKDLVIIADGTKVSSSRNSTDCVTQHVQSTHIPRIVFNPPPLQKNGQSAFRALIPFDLIHANPALAAIFANNPNGFWVPFDLRSSRPVFAVTYPCRALELLNIALVHKTLPKYADHEDWHSSGSLEAMLEVVDNFNPLIKDLFKLTPEVKVYTLFRRDPFPTYVKSRAILIGDAAAIMQPQHAQGGTIALEEGAALGVLFSNLRSKDEVKERVKWYDEMMGKHIRTIQLLSDSMLGVENDAREKLEALMGDDKTTLPPFGSMQFSKPVRDFIWPYDVIGEATKFVERKGLEVEP